ncbi:MAG: DUF3575 domain-containing protein [Bacteroides sp.]|nr:DUF3575 domain-containing protein [Bacteroides sp.]
MKRRILLLLIFLAPLIPVSVLAQQFAVRTNLVPIADGALNAGVEYALGRRSTVDLSGMVRPWRRTEKYVNKYWLVQPEYRYWTCQKFNGTYWGAYLNGAQFNVGGKDMPFGLFPWLERHRYEGWLAGVGVSWGYHLMLDRHWNLEFSAGVGYEYIHYRKYETPEVCTPLLEEGHYHYFGLSKLSASIVYVF